MPGMDGFDLLRRVKSAYPSIKVIVLTGYARKQSISDFLLYGADEYLSKPFTPAALMDRLRRAMRAAGRSPGVRAHVATLLTSTFWIEGNLHVSEELERFTDAWEALVGDARSYVPLTDATVKTLDGRSILATSDLIEVRKDQVAIVMPGTE